MKSLKVGKSLGQWNDKRGKSGQSRVGKGSVDRGDNSIKSSKTMIASLGFILRPPGSHG